MNRKKKKKIPRCRGQVEMVDLTGLRPNDWNPNVVADHVMASIKTGYIHDGWLVSQALLVWRTDETGATHNVIIDGEHRWLCALDAGLLEGPVVFLDGLTEAEAKALTIALNKKRGQFDPNKLAAVMAELDVEISKLGFLEEELLEATKAAEGSLAEAMGKLGNSKPERKRKRKRKEEANVQYSILIECSDEADQVAKLQECTEKGWPCRALI